MSRHYTVLDPRLEGAKKMLSSVSRIIAVMSSKGGVGKTLFSAVFASIASRKGFRVGLLDLDITNPGLHVVLGIDPLSIQPGEEKGITPVSISGLEFMSTVFYTRDNPSLMRGTSVDNAIREVLAATRWSRLDILVVDTAPGLSDVAISTLEYFPGVEVVVVATPSRLSINSIEKLLKLLSEMKYKKYLVENMSSGNLLVDLARKYHTVYLGSIDYYREVEEYIGDIEKLVSSRFGRSVEEIANKIL